MKKIIISIALFIAFIILPFDTVEALEKVACGDNIALPKQLPDLINLVINIILIAVPIILIVMGLIDFARSVIGSNQEEIKKGQKRFLSRLFAGVCTFFVIVLVRLCITSLAGLNDASMLDCIDCVLNGSDNCHEYVEPEKEVNDDNKTGDNKVNIETPNKDDEETDSKASENDEKSNDSDKNKDTDKNDDSTKKESTKTTNNKNIFIGDSRTVDMCGTYKLCEGNEYIAQVGKGYSWFTNSAVPSATAKTKNGNYNIIILMGVNDVGKTKSIGSAAADKYYNRIEGLATSNWEKHQIIFVSVNPVIDGKSNAYMAGVNGFNTQMKSKINSAGLSNLKYCNTSSSLNITSSNSPDGLHYNKTISKKIYDKIMNSCI